MCEQALLAAAKQDQTEAFGTLCQPSCAKAYPDCAAHHQKSRRRRGCHCKMPFEAFIHIKNFDGRSSFSTWLTRIAINSALMTLRKKRSSREIPIGSGELGANAVGWDGPDPSANPEKLYAQREKERLLRKAIRKLRPTIRQAVEFQLRELSMEENQLG